jgi:hypothetical protein
MYLITSRNNYILFIISNTSYYKIIFIFLNLIFNSLDVYIILRYLIVIILNLYFFIFKINLASINIFIIVYIYLSYSFRSFKNIIILLK